MTRRERTFFWLALFAFGFAALYALSAVLVPFVAGMAIAYFLDPLVDRCERAGMPRWLGTTLVLVGFIALMIGFVLLLVPVLHAQVLRLAEIVPLALRKLEPLLLPVLGQFDLVAGGTPLNDLTSVAGDGLRWAVGVFAGLVRGSVAVANILSLVLITPVVAFYLLRDWDLIVAKIESWLPHAQHDIIVAQLREVDRTLSGFVRGQVSVCLILAVFYAIALSLAGLDFGIVIGIIVGLISFVPFVGAIVGGLLSLGLAAAQFDMWTPIAIIAAIFVAGQVLEGNVLTPKLVGDAVGLHPVWVIFALLAGGALFGFLGVLLALPAAAVSGVLTRFALSRYLASSLHRHGIPAPDDPAPGSRIDGNCDGFDGGRP